MVRAVFENGVFRPTVPVNLPEHTEVEFDPKPLASKDEEVSLDRIYEIMSRRFSTGRHDLAERHNELEP